MSAAPNAPTETAAGLRVVVHVNRKQPTAARRNDGSAEVAPEGVQDLLARDEDLRRDDCRGDGVRDRLEPQAFA
jgi:hypothetical protein